VTRIATPFLSESQVTVFGTPAEFQTLVASEVGGILLDSDGEEAAIEALQAFLDADTASSSDLDLVLSDADFILGDFEGGTITPVVTDAAATFKAGTDQLTDLLGDTNPPTGH
jgi:hypothetical protein